MNCSAFSQYCEKILEISLHIQQAFTALCRQIVRITRSLPTVELPAGWLIYRYCRTLMPEGLTGHCGAAAHAMLRLWTLDHE